jgi:hypothetical protein
MTAADRAHPYYFSFDELDAIVLRKDTDLGHAMVLVDVEASLFDPNRHTFSLRFGRNHRPGY